MNNFKLIIFDSFFIKQNLEKEFLMPNMFKEADEKKFKDSIDRINTKSAFLIDSGKIVKKFEASRKHSFRDHSIFLTLHS